MADRATPTGEKPLHVLRSMHTATVGVALMLLRFKMYFDVKTGKSKSLDDSSDVELLSHIFHTYSSLVREHSRTAPLVYSVAVQYKLVNEK